MARKLNKLQKNNSEHFGAQGFSLIEVMIALAIFAVFITSFIAGHGYNIQDSSSMRMELKLKEFAQIKINELIVSPPDLKESLIVKPETGKFESDESIKYEITYQKFEVPDYEKIQGKEEGEEEQEEEKSPIEKKIFENVKKNLEKLVWQVEVKVIDSTTEASYAISTWLYNDKAKVEIDAL